MNYFNKQKGYAGNNFPKAGVYFAQIYFSFAPHFGHFIVLGIFDFPETLN